MRARFLVPVLCCAGLGDLAVCRSETAPSSVTPPAGWWRVERSEPDDPSANGGAFRFRAEGYDLVRPDGRVDSRAATWNTSQGRLRSTGAMPFELIGAGEDGLRLVVHPGHILHLRRVDASKAAELDRQAGASVSVESICDQAERCCREAMRLLGAECDVAVELAGKRSTKICQDTIQGLLLLLDRTGKTPPASCQAAADSNAPAGKP